MANKAAPEVLDLLRSASSPLALAFVRQDWEAIERLDIAEVCAAEDRKGYAPLQILMQASTLTEQALTIVLEKAPPQVWLATDQVRAPRLICPC